MDLSEVEWEDRDDVVSDPLQTSSPRTILTINDSPEAGPERAMKTTYPSLIVGAI